MPECYQVSEYCTNCKQHIDLVVAFGQRRDDFLKTAVCPACGCRFQPPTSEDVGPEAANTAGHG